MKKRNRIILSVVSVLMVILLTVFILIYVFVFAQERISDVVYWKDSGTEFTMDVFKPRKSNKGAVVWIVSDGLYSSREGISPLIAAPFTSQGFTVFMVVHGSVPSYNISQIVDQLQRSVRYIRANAEHFDIRTDKIGISGGSSGGHLALLIAGLGDDGNPEAEDLIERTSSKLNAAAVIFPPTDFMNWGEPGVTHIDAKKMSGSDRIFGFDLSESREENENILKKYSPITYVNKNSPPTLVAHGNMDQVVPFQQSERYIARCTELGVTCKLISIPKRGHEPGTVIRAAPKLIQWYKEYLK